MNWGSLVDLKKKSPRKRSLEDEDHNGPTISVAQFFAELPKPVAPARAAKEDGTKKVISAKAPAKGAPSQDMRKVISEKAPAKDAPSQGMSGKTVVFTGNLSIDRETAIELAVAAGAKVTSAVSGKTNYLVLGSVLEDGRAVEEGSKFKKMASLKTEGKPGPVGIDEAEFLTLVGKPESPKASVTDDEVKSTGNGYALWVDKYQPTSIEECIGNNANVSKLVDWLARWKRKAPMDGKAKPAGFGFRGGNPDAKAVLISGPPGIGKSLLAKLACMHAGFQVIEYNASDYRNKSHVDLLGVTLAGSNIIQSTGLSSNACLVMDEVDGMSSGDRGGGAALIQVIKKTKIPIICICNDRMSPKVRSLANYCFDLKFVKPPKNLIVKRALAILKAENIGSPNTNLPIVEQIVEGSDCDIRQVINQLQGDASNWDSLVRNWDKKDKSTMLSGFEACREILARKSDMNDRLDMFFVDYELIPLLMQQNYLKCYPANKPCGSDHVESAYCLSFGDVISKAIRTEQNWNLLPLFGLIGAVFVPPKMEPGFSPYPEFPMWFGKYSHSRKIARISQELQCVVSETSSVTGRNILQSNYPHTLYVAFVNELRRAVTADNVSLSILDALGVARNDLLELLTELLLPWQTDVYAETLDGKTKAAITRICNAHHSHLKSGGVNFRSAKAAKTEPAFKLADEEDEEEENVDRKVKEGNSLVKAAAPKKSANKRIKK